MQGLNIKNSIEISYDKDYYFNLLERLFFIGENEIPGSFEDGSRIMDYFWEDATSTTVKGIIFEVKRLITKYVTDLNLLSVSAGIIPMNNSKELLLIIEIEYSLKNSPTIKDDLSFTKIRGTQA